MSLADDLKIEPPCPRCNAKLQIALSKARAGMGTTCPSCGARIEFKGDGGNAADALNELENTFAKLGGR